MKSWILYGNFWVSAGAASLALSTSFLLNLKPDIESVLLVFFACLSIYNYHRIFRIATLYNEKKSERHRWIIQHLNSLRFISALSGLIALFLFYRIANISIVVSALPFALIAIFYVIPLYKKDGIWRRLRDIPFLKVFLIAAVWSYATVVIPLASSAMIYTASFWLTVAQRFLFMLAITFPFDIRDIEHDQEHGVVTLSARIGVSGVRKLSHLLLISMLLVVLIATQFGIYSRSHSAGLLFSALESAWLISKLKINSSEFFYTALLDGTMIDQMVWIWLSAWLF